MPPSKTPLRPISAFVDANPPREGWRSAESTLVYLHPCRRFRIHAERTADVGYGVWRSDELAERGILGAEADSREFAAELVQALAPDLSVRNLRDLVVAFAKELAEMEGRRAARGADTVSASPATPDTSGLPRPTRARVMTRETLTSPDYVKGWNAAVGFVEAASSGGAGEQMSPNVESRPLKG